LRITDFGFAAFPELFAAGAIEATKLHVVAGVEIVPAHGHLKLALEILILAVNHHLHKFGDISLDILQVFLGYLNIPVVLDLR
jgi:hypothetical protein